MKLEIKDRIEKIKNGEVPKGYINTYIGLFPDNWDIDSLDNVCIKVTDGSHFSPVPIEKSRYHIATVTNMSSTGFDKESLTPISEDDFYNLEKNGCRPLNGDVLLSKDGTIGKVSLFNQYEDEIVLLSSIAIITPNEKITSNYLEQILKYRRTISRILNMKKGSAIKRIILKDIKKVIIPIPSLPEQQKIASILSTWDKAIELKEKLIEEKKKQKKGLMQKLLTGEVRLPGFDGEWKEVTLGEIADISTGDKDTQDKIDNGQYPFYVRSENIERINSYAYDGEAILIPGDGRVGEIFHYINGKFNFHQRVYKLSDFSEFVRGKYIYYYLCQFFKKQAMKYTAKATVDSLRRPMLTDMEISVPSKNEQEAIANILSTADKEISLLERELEAIKQQKKGLMELLLTGIVRVNTEN